VNAFVFTDNTLLLAEMIGGAKKLSGGGKVTAIVLGTEDDANNICKLGTDTICWLGEQGNRLVDDFIPTIINLIQSRVPDVFLIGSSVCGRAIAGRVAAAIGTAAIVGTKEIREIDGGITASHMIYGGDAVRIEKLLGKTLVAIVGAGFSDAAEPVTGNGVVEPVPFIEPVVKVKLIETKEKPPSNSGVATAKRVVGVGRGFSSKEEIELAKELAAELDGEVGYSRPVTEGDPPLMKGEPYIGVSGIQIKPDLYLAVAISGQTQHVIASNESKVVACINKDANALMFRHSDYGIVADFKEALPALTKAIKAAR